jgi:hypothetical protein
LTKEPSCKDEARVGQQGTLTRIWAKRGTRPRIKRDQRFTWAYLFGAICPARGTAIAAIAFRPKSCRAAPGPQGKFGPRLAAGVMGKTGSRCRSRKITPDFGRSGFRVFALRALDGACGQFFAKRPDFRKIPCKFT